MATTGPPAQRREQVRGPGERSIAPIRWPRPSGGGLALMALWLLGAVVGAAAPALIVPPGSDGAPTGAVVGAFSVTVVGVLIMVAACLLVFRRARDRGILVLAVVPTGVLLAGGLMMAGTQLFG